MLFDKSAQGYGQHDAKNVGGASKEQAGAGPSKSTVFRCYKDPDTGDLYESKY